MAVKTEKFETVGHFGDVEKLERTVETPMPESDDGSGYTKQTNRMVCYKVGEHVFKVSKVSNRGWSVTHYHEGEFVDMHTDYEDMPRAAHRIARTMVEEMLEDD